MGDFNDCYTGRANVVMRSDQKTPLGIFIDFFTEQFGETSKADAILCSTQGFWLKAGYFCNSDHSLFKCPCLYERKIKIKKQTPSNPKHKVGSWKNILESK